MLKQLVYYHVPDKYKSSYMFKILNEYLVQDNVIEIVLTDPIKPLSLKSLFHAQQFFVDDIQFTSSLLWELKKSDEKVFLSNIDGNNAFEITSINDLILQLGNYSKNGGGWIIAFQKNRRTTRAVINDNLESLIIVITGSEVNDTEEILKKWAIEENYNKYEMGE